MLLSLLRAALLAGLASAAAAAPAHALVIGELRVRGPAGANDEFVELVNEADAPVTVSTSDGSPGWAVAAGGVVRFVVPNGTTIPPLGHYLGVNSLGFPPALATANASWTTDIPDNAGVALFRTATPANFGPATRLDAIGSASEANALYREGAGYPALTPFSIDYSFGRDLRAGGIPRDTGNNAADLVFVDTNGTSAGAGQRLGAPSPQGAATPYGTRTRNLEITPIDPSVGLTSVPNAVFDPTSFPAQNATSGRLFLRRYVRNLTADPIQALQFQIVDLSTFPSPAGTADLRPSSTGDTVVATPGGVVSVIGAQLKQPPSQPNGGGFGSVLRVPLAQPLAPGARVAVQFLAGIQQTGGWRLCLHAAGLPAVGATLSATGVVGAGTVPAAQCSEVPDPQPAPPGADPTPNPPAGPDQPAGPGVPAPPAAPIALVRAAPTVRLALGRKSTARRLSVVVACPAGLPDSCRGTLRASGKAGKRTLKLGSIGFAVASGRSRTLVLRPSAKVRRVLARKKRARISLTAVTRGDAGRTRTTTAAIRLRR